jgi:hypothetical protein
MNSISLTGVGAVLVTVINAALPLLGLELPAGSVESGVMGLMNVIGFALLIYGQARRPDVVGFVGKK